MIMSLATYCWGSGTYDLSTLLNFLLNFGGYFDEWHLFEELSGEAISHVVKFYSVEKKKRRISNLKKKKKKLFFFYYHKTVIINCVSFFRYSFLSKTINAVTKWECSSICQIKKVVIEHIFILVFLLSVLFLEWK